MEVKELDPNADNQRTRGSNEGNESRALIKLMLRKKKQSSNTTAGQSSKIKQFSKVQRKRQSTNKT